MTFTTLCKKTPCKLAFYSQRLLRLATSPQHALAQAILTSSFHKIIKPTPLIIPTQTHRLAFQTLGSRSQAHKMAMNKATSNTQTMGKSGTKIYSIDEIDFWGELQNEIAGVAYAPGDSYQPTTSELKNKEVSSIKPQGCLPYRRAKQIKRVESYLATLNNKFKNKC